ncbi:MAG: hypothetical protein IIB15_07590 [Chloroflexi bacterium]|nr:hypothetical protein [Chloroflexota bacterium]
MRASLSQKGVELEERDFFQERFSEEELRALIGDHPPADFFSWNSPSFKKLGVSRDALDDDRLIELMVGEPRLIRRPLIQVGSDLIVGTDKKAMEQAFP